MDAADVAMQTAIDEGFEVYEVPDLIFPDVVPIDTIH
jgi:hypothetical protein